MKNLISYQLLFIFSLILFPVISHAACDPKINRTLKLGSKGEDVKILQKFLNDSVETKIAVSGVNSKGKENGTFDLATQKAVKVFQKMNFNVILKPAGLTVPNGIIGVNARKLINSAICDEINPYVSSSSSNALVEDAAKFNKSVSDSLVRLEKVKQNIASTSNKFKEEIAKINALSGKLDTLTNGQYKEESIVKKISDSITGTFSLMGDNGKVELLGIYPTTPSAGDSIYVLVSKPESTNKLYIGNTSYTVTRASSTDKFVSFTIPVGIMPGSYDMYIENSLGKSDKIKINIGKSEIIEPVIATLTPNHGNIGTEVVISGNNFSKSNTIQTTTKTYTNVVSLDGKTLKFKVGAESSMLDSQGKLVGTLPFSVYVNNEKGDSNYMSFKLD